MITYTESGNHNLAYIEDPCKDRPCLMGTNGYVMISYSYTVVPPWRHWLGRWHALMWGQEDVHDLASGDRCRKTPRFKIESALAERVWIRIKN